MRYRYLLADNDNTLMDFDAAERASLHEALLKQGIAEAADTFSTYHTLNKRLWEALERGEMTQAKLKVERFVLLLRALGEDEAKAPRLAAAFGEELARHAELLPGAMALLEAVRPHMKIALVSNGVSETQRGRLTRCPFTPLLDAVLISGEIGISKPDPRMVEMALAQLGCTNKREAILLGDSATADIAAARAAGIDSIHLHLRTAPCPQATYRAANLDEARAILMGSKQ